VPAYFDLDDFGPAMGSDIDLSNDLAPRSRGTTDLTMHGCIENFDNSDLRTA
jgi:hypothetical protein